MNHFKSSVNSLTKAVNALYLKAAATMKLKPKLLALFLALIIIILLALSLGLGDRRREGYSQMDELAPIIDKMNGTINVIDWQSDEDRIDFINRVNHLWEQKMLYMIVQGGVDLQTYDKNVNNKIYRLNADYIGNVLPQYVDDVSIKPAPKPAAPKPKPAAPKPKPAAAKPAAPKPAAAKPAAAKPAAPKPKPPVKKPAAPKPPVQNPPLQNYTRIDVNNSITKSKLNILNAHIEKKINQFSTLDPYNQKRLQRAYDSLMAYANKFGKLAHKNPQTNVSSLFFTDILGSGGSGGLVWGVSRGDRRMKLERDRDMKLERERDMKLERERYMRLERERRYSGENYDPINGITANDIPPGTSDLYMLKTRMVPPSSPVGAAKVGAAKVGAGAVPGAFARGSSANAADINAFESLTGPSTTCSSPAPVPPCPACERCPEPAFDCKRVPKYNSAAVNQYLPRPVLADFSQFGM
jgi:hypothetical protein